MFLCKRNLPEPDAPGLSLAEREAEAHAAWKAAERTLADACFQLNQYRRRNPEQVPVKRAGDHTIIQITPTDELRMLSAAENHARYDRDEKQNRWATIHKQLHPDATRIAGELVVP